MPKRRDDMGLLRCSRGRRTPNRTFGERHENRAHYIIRIPQRERLCEKHGLGEKRPLQHARHVGSVGMRSDDPVCHSQSYCELNAVSRRPCELLLCAMLLRTASWNLSALPQGTASKKGRALTCAKRCSHCSFRCHTWVPNVCRTQEET